MITVNYLGDPDNGVIFAGYVGSLLLAGAYLAVTCMTSAMTRNQVVSFILSVVICFFLILAGCPPVTDLLVHWARPARDQARRGVQRDDAFRRLPERRARFARRAVLPLGDRLLALHHRRDHPQPARGLNQLSIAMKQKKLETLLYSAVGVAVMFVVIVAVNFIASAAKTRIDLTEDKLYTLSAGTQGDPREARYAGEVRFYCSQSEARVPSQIRRLTRSASRICSANSARRRAARSRSARSIPKPDSDAEDAAQLDGVEGQQTRTGGEKFYLGLAVSLDPRRRRCRSSIPDRERLLEYDLARAIAPVITHEQAGRRRHERAADVRHADEPDDDAHGPAAASGRGCSSAN